MKGISPDRVKISTLGCEVLYNFTAFLLVVEKNQMEYGIIIIINSNFLHVKGVFYARLMSNAERFRSRHFA